MPNNYIWIIESLDCVPSVDGQSNVVSNVHWKVAGTDGVHNSSVYGTQSLTYTSTRPFIKYSSLTKEDVIKWVQDEMGAEQVLIIQTTLDNLISNAANPPIITPALPWNN